MAPVLDRFQSLHAVDFAAIAAYFAVVIWVGFYYSRRQKSTGDYFLAGRILSWFSVGVFYTVLGGLRAVIWTDVVQFFILLGGAIFTVPDPGRIMAAFVPDC